jgi:DNA-binding NarL/FixJ family response regulator
VDVSRIMGEQANTSANIGGAPPRVFIADPSAAVIERLATVLDDVAVIAGRATNARDAIDGIRRVNPHLTVFDVALEKGIELLGEIKKHQPRTVTVVLTHSAEETTRRICLRLGADYFLDKIREFERVREIVLAHGGQGNPPFAS